VRDLKALLPLKHVADRKKNKCVFYTKFSRIEVAEVLIALLSTPNEILLERVVEILMVALYDFALTTSTTLDARNSTTCLQFHIKRDEPCTQKYRKIHCFYKFSTENKKQTSSATTIEMIFIEKKISRQLI
jgi:hypothetical protein